MPSNHFCQREVWTACQRGGRHADQSERRIAVAGRGRTVCERYGWRKRRAGAYAIVDGRPGKGRDLVNGLGIPDGIAINCHGDIYVTEHTDQRIRVFTPQGKQIATIKIDANVTNAAFGGADGKTLFIIGAGAVWKIALASAVFRTDRAAL
ncbi:MAG: SMP-30/gluconolactonase/LRE family protein [Gemmatimonadaceae bacterium]